MDGFGSKWTVQGLNCTVQTSKSGRSWSKKVDGPEIKKWTVQKEKNWTVKRKKTGQSLGMKVDGPRGSKWMVQKDQSGRSKRLKVY